MGDGSLFPFPEKCKKILIPEGIEPRDKEAYRSFQRSDRTIGAGKREFASHEGVKKGSRRSVSVSGPKETRDRLPRDRVFRFPADVAAVALPIPDIQLSPALSCPHLPGRANDRAISMMSSREAVGSG